MANSKYKNELKRLKTTDLSFILNDFSKGMVDDIISKSYSEETAYSTDLKNFILDKQGDLYKRPGTALFVNGDLVDRYNLNFNNEKTQGTLFSENIIYGVYNGVIYQLNSLRVNPLIYYEYYENNVLDNDTDNDVINTKLLVPGYYIEHKPFLETYFLKNEEYISLDGDATSSTVKDDFVYWIVGQKLLYKPINNKYWRLDSNGVFVLSQQTGQPILTDVLNVNYVDKCQAFLEVPSKRIEYSSFNNLGANEYAKNPTHRVVYYKDFSNNSVIEIFENTKITDNFFGTTQTAKLKQLEYNIFSGREQSPLVYAYNPDTAEDVIYQNTQIASYDIGQTDLQNGIKQVALSNVNLNLTWTDQNGDIVSDPDAFFLNDIDTIYWNYVEIYPPEYQIKLAFNALYYVLYNSLPNNWSYYMTFNLLGEFRTQSAENFAENIEINGNIYNYYYGYDAEDPALKEELAYTLVPVDIDFRTTDTFYRNKYVTGDMNFTASRDQTDQIVTPAGNRHEIIDSVSNYQEQGILFKEKDIKAINDVGNIINLNLNINGNYNYSNFGRVSDNKPFDVNLDINEIYQDNAFSLKSNFAELYGFQTIYTNIFEFLGDAVDNNYQTSFMYWNFGDIFFQFYGAGDKENHVLVNFRGSNYDGYSTSGTLYLELPILQYKNIYLSANETHEFDGSDKGIYNPMFINFNVNRGEIRWEIDDEKLLTDIEETINYAFIFPEFTENGRVKYKFDNLISFFGYDNWVNENFEIYYQYDNTLKTSLGFNQDTMKQIKEVLERQNPTTKNYPEDEQWTLVDPPQFIFTYYQSNVTNDNTNITAVPNFGVYTYFLYLDETYQNAYTDINFELSGIVPNQYPITTGKPTIFYGCVADLQTGLAENSLGAYTKYYQWKLYRTEEITDTTIIEPDLDSKDQWNTGFEATRQKISLANSTGYILYLFAMKELDYEQWIEINENTKPNIADIQFVSYEFLPQDLLPDITVDDYGLFTSSGALKINNGILNYKDQSFLYGKDRIYVSLLNNFNYFPFSFVMTLSNNFGTLNVQSLKYIQKSLVVLTNKSLYNLSGNSPADFSLSLINADYGLLSKNANAAIDVGLGFLSTQGIVKLTNYAWGTKANLNIEYIGKNIQNRIYELLGDAENYQYSSALLYLNYFVINLWDIKNEKYYLYFYDDLNKSWFRWESKYFDLLNMYIYNGDLYLVRKNNLEILKVGYKTLYDNFLDRNGYIDRYNTLDINKADDIVETVFESPLIKFDYDDYRKKYKRLNIYLNANNIPSNFDVLVYNENGILLNEDFEIRETSENTLDIYPKNGVNKIGQINVKNYFDIGYYDAKNFYQENNQNFNLIEEKYHLAGEKGLYIKYILKHKDDADFGLDYVTIDLKIKKSN